MADNCVTHTSTPAYSTCDHCGAPICESCYDDFALKDEGEEQHLCAKCFTNYVKDQIVLTKETKKSIITEFVLIGVGFVIGLVIGVFLYLNMMSSLGENDSIFLPIILLVYCPFIFGSFVTIIKKIRRTYLSVKGDEDVVDGNDLSSVLLNFIFKFVILLFVTLGCLIVAPITTIVRIIQRIIDIRRISAIDEDNQNFLTRLNAYIQNSIQAALTQGLVAATATGEVDDEDIDMSAILKSSYGSEAALCENGEIIRKAHNR